MSDFRMERDTLGEVRVPAHALYGAQTQRAIENFSISGLVLPPSFLRAQAAIKLAAALANRETGLLDPERADALERSAREVLEGTWDGEFVVDVFQAGAGTSQNMNLNEVLANRAEELLGGHRGEYSRVHPNDHANMSQSTNDTIHAAIHVASVQEATRALIPAALLLADALGRKAIEFDPIVKCARTHLQDAVPIRLGQEFAAWESMIRRAAARVEEAVEELRELCLGGTAVGTGLNTPPGYRNAAIDHLNALTGERFRSAPNLFEAMQSLDPVVAFSGSVRVLATACKKIADDIRLLSSGPRTGLRELRLPAVQPGSSIMPGKVNPVMAEMLNMVVSQVMGCDLAITHAAQGGQLDLNVMMPVVAYNVLLEIRILGNGMAAFAQRCVDGIEADADVCLRHAESSNTLATALSPRIGYHRAAELAQAALKEDRLVRDLAREGGQVPEEELERLLDLDRMTRLPEEG